MDIRSGSGRQLIVIGFLGALLAACGGGGGSSSDSPPPDTQAPAAKINFPTAQALTTADSITVTGTATDSSTISSVTVNGVAATSSNDFANWSATVSLTAGDNAITVATADNQGNSAASADSITIRNEVALLNPNDIALDSANSRALLVDEVLRAVIAVNLDTGQRSVVSDAGQGSGAAFNTPSSIALDSANSRALVGDGTQIIAVDLATGDRSLFSNLGTGNQALDLALDGSTRVLVVTTDSVLEVPLSSGTAAVFSTAGTGTGDPFNSPASIVIDSASTRALVADSAAAAVVAVDLATGDRSLFASAGDSNGDDLQTPLGIALSGDGNNALVTDLGSASVAPMIVSINLTSQARTVLSAGGAVPTGTGLDFSFPVAVVADSNAALVVDPALAAVLSVDESTGNRDIASSARVGEGFEFNGPFNIGYDTSNDRALVTDNVTRAIYTVDLDSGARTLLSGGGAGTGTEFESPFNLAISDSQAFVTDADTASVLAVDLASGNRTVLASDIGANANKSPLGIALDDINNTLYLSVIENDGASPQPALVGSELFSLATDSATATPFALSGTGFTALTFAQNLIIDSNAGTAYVADTVADLLFAVTLSGGDTRNLGEITNSAPTGVAPFQDVTLIGTQAVLVDSSLASVVAIDTDTTTRSVISGGTVGNGVALQDPTGIAYAPDRNVLFVVDRLSFAIFAVEPASGDRVIISR